MFGNFGKMLKAAGELKRKMPEMREKLARSEFTAGAGGGAVTATVSGKGALVDLKIDEATLADPEMSAETLAELIKAAVAAAQEQAGEAAAEMMKELTGGMDLPDMEGLT